jgi:hypothetical protein
MLKQPLHNLVHLTSQIGGFPILKKLMKHEVLFKRKAQYGRPPYKDLPNTIHLNEKVNRTEHPP